jgi:hypothetical protein
MSTAFVDDEQPDVHHRHLNAFSCECVGGERQKREIVDLRQMLSAAILVGCGHFEGGGCSMVREQLPNRVRREDLTILAMPMIAMRSWTS